MESEPILATFTDGVFRPVAPEFLGLPEGQEVVLTVQPIDQATYILTLTRMFYAGLSEEEIAVIEQAIRHRPNFFGDDEDVAWQEFSLESALRDMAEADEVTYTEHNLKEKFKPGGSEEIEGWQ